MKIKRFFRLFLTVVLSLTLLLISPSPASAVDWDLSTWTEVDIGDDITVTSTSIVYDLERQDEAWVYKDFTAGYWNDSFQIDFEWEITLSISGSEMGVVAVTNTVGTERELVIDPLYPSLSVHLYNGAVPDDVRLTVYEVDSGLSSYASVQMIITEGVKYYYSFVRDEEEGTYGRITLTQYSDEARETYVNSAYVDLHEKQDFQYIEAMNSYGASGVYTTTGTIGNISGFGITTTIPTVYTYPQYNNGDEALLMGLASSTADIIDSGFDIGIASANYTYSYEGNLDETSGIFTYATDNYTIGETYYFRAKAENSYGWGYGIERSFVWSGGNMFSVNLSNAVVIQNISGNFSCSFNVYQSPIFSANVTAFLSVDYPPYTNEETLYLLYSDGQNFAFDTWDGVYGTGGPLLPDTTYYYQGCVEFEGISYFTEVKSFTTSAPVFPDIPSVSIISILDVSQYYNDDYVVEVEARITTTNTTDWIITQGIEFSLGKSPTGSLLPTIYRYLATDVSLSNVYKLVFWLGNADWYDGETLYFRAFIKTVYYDEVYSATASFTPDSTDGGGVAVGGDGIEDIPIVTDFSDTIRAIRLQWGLVGTFGTWAFLGIFILGISLLYGIAMVSVPNGVPKLAVGVAWLITTIAIVGGFIFTGELGIWPIIILVGGLVAMVIVFASFKLSGGGANNG